MPAFLRHITFTGVDAHTDIQALCDLQRRFPIAEFGILLSRNWSENGNRFPDPALLAELKGRDLNLSAHLCGSLAHDAANGYWNRVNKVMLGHRTLFKRIQLNVSGWKNHPKRIAGTFLRTETIIQQKSPDDMPLFDGSRWLPGLLSVLLDASGGQGIDTEIRVLNDPHKVGYAGGINPDNAARKLRFLLEHPDTGDFWIDMESDVRTDDWFDLDKVEKVLEACMETIKEHKPEQISNFYKKNSHT